MNKTLFLALALASATVLHAGETFTFPLEGSVTTTRAVAVPTENLYLYTTLERADALACELRIYDRQGVVVPYVWRQRMIPKVEAHTRTQPVAIRGVTETNETLVVRTMLPMNTTSIRINTPLRDYEQTVKVYEGAHLLAEGTICDYSRYANYSRTTILVNGITNDKEVTFVFAKPTSVAESNHFEQTLHQNAQGELNTKDIRQSVVNRPFRIDAIQALIPFTQTKFVAADPLAIPTTAAAIESVDKQTLLFIHTRFAPLQFIELNTTSENFKRTIHVATPRRDGLKDLLPASTIYDASFLGRHDKSLRLNASGKHGELFLRIEDKDNPPLTFEDLAVNLGITPMDVIFLAKPGETYTLAIEQGAEKPQYDDIHFQHVAEVPRFSYTTDRTWATDNTNPNFQFVVRKINLIPYIAVGIFVILGLVCFWLFRTTNEPQPEI